jgi:hypothetical protein
MNKELFYKKYNYIKIEEYIKTASEITDKIERLKFWKKLLFQYQDDATELRNLNVIYGLTIL